MKNIYLLICMALVFIYTGCDTITTEVFAKNDYYTKDELAAVGYLSNKGAVVNIQETIDPLNTGNTSEKVENAIVELYTVNDKLATTFTKIDNYNYITPVGFIPSSNELYYLSISSPGFETITSAPVSVLDYTEIDLVKLAINKTNYWRDDTIPYFLWGRPREIWLSYYINNCDKKISNNTSRFLFDYHSNVYEYGEKDFTPYTKPDFFINLGSGANKFTSVPDSVSDSFRFFDQITLDSTITYNDSVYHVLDRIDSVLVQSFIFSDGMVDFFENVNQYLENRYDPFSIVAKEIPSNISNGAGYFGGIFISEKKVDIPTVANDTVVYVY